MSSSVITYRQALTEAMRQEMRDDPTVIVLGEDVGRHGGARGATRGLFAEFGAERVIDTPISEMAIAGAACGAALSGLRPVAENYIGDIIMFMADILVTSASKLHFATGGELSAPMVIRGADGSRPDGGPHQDTLAVWFAHIPGLKVVVPATPADAKGLLASAIRDDNPVIVFEPLQLYDTEGEVPDGKHHVPIGKAEVRAEGTDLTVVGAGVGVHLGLKAREDWGRKGVSIEVVDLRSLQAARHRHHRALGAQDGSAGGRARGLGHLRHQRRDPCLRHGGRRGAEGSTGASWHGGDPSSREHHSSAAGRAQSGPSRCGDRHMHGPSRLAAAGPRLRGMRT